MVVNLRKNVGVGGGELHFNVVVGFIFVSLIPL